MVIHYLYVVCIPRGPHEANAVLIVDPNTVLPFPVSFEGFQTVSGRIAQVLQEGSGVYHHQLSSCRFLNGLRYFSTMLPIEDLLSLSVPETLYHSPSYNGERNGSRSRRP